MFKTRMALLVAMIFTGSVPLASCALAEGEQPAQQQDAATSSQAAGTDASQPAADDAMQPAQPEAPAAADAQSQPQASLPHNAQQQNGGAQDEAAEQPGPQNDYEVKTFFADYKQYTIGDVVPDLYRSKPYNITDFKIRHLPAPQPGSHWTYMGGNYVLITDADGKILQAKAGEIFYHN